MKVIVIADSLTNDVALPARDGEATAVNVGRQTIARTMGENERYGRGPLPTFLRAAAQAREQGRDVHLVLARDLHEHTDEQRAELERFGEHAMRGTEGAELVGCVADLADRAHVIDTATLALPPRRLHEVLADALGAEPFSLTANERNHVTVVVCGFHTNVRVLYTAFKLRNEYELPRVIVCPHLVGSSDERAHELTLQVSLPNALITVEPSLDRLVADLGFAMDAVDGCGACRLEPREVVDRMSAEQRTALEHQFQFDTAVSLRPLGGGFSGSLLFLATPSRGGQKQAPVVVKVDAPSAIHREVRGHHQVKDLLGIHVPAMHAPVSVGNVSTVRMTLAAMEGRPRTLQHLYGEAQDATGWARFTNAFEKALDLLASDLYQNTRRQARFSPYQAFELTGPNHARWLRGNLPNIIAGADLGADTLDLGHGLSVLNPLIHGLPLLGHIDHLDADVALCHGDLNFANLLTDDTGAIWIIDWPHTEESPIEVDFAKMENDISFVVSQAFVDSDLPALLDLQRFLAATLVPPATPPPSLALERFELQKLYHAVRLLRERYRAIKTDAHLELHAIARLRFALHTLSFNKALSRGDCELPQLKHALLTVSVLIDQLRNSPLHRSGPRERPEAYPPRVAVPLQHESWDVPLEGYAPPDATYTHESPDGSTQGDDDDVKRVSGLRERAGLTSPLRFDDRGRPLNPLGRTGLGGRGFFYRWGPNLAVDAVVMRVNAGRKALEFALVKREDTGQWSLPGTMVREGERPSAAFARVVAEKLGLSLDPARANRVDHGPIRDYRNTDNAWVESIVFETTLPDHEQGPLSPARADVKSAAWLALDEDFAPQLFASHVRILAEAISRFLADGSAKGVKRQALEALVGRL